ncbi:hypothetical protein HKX48_009447 [Thoreauomyces humboldtii]|nr:hypothetical protein HKX48_009447 [Thoreauomyces humboldtii]
MPARPSVVLWVWTVANCWTWLVHASCSYLDKHQFGTIENIPGIGPHAQIAKRTTAADVQSLDGSGNNLIDPSLDGTNGNLYIRKSPAAFAAPTGTQPRIANLPNARQVSQQALSLSPYTYNNRLASDFLPLWGLFIHSDVTGPIRNIAEPFNIDVPSGDPILDPAGTGNVIIPVSRASHIGTYIEPLSGQEDRVYVNAITGILDGSSLYGMGIGLDPRLYTGGLLNFTMYDVLGEAPPLDSTGQFLWPQSVGNLVPHMTVTYILLFRDHNRRARLYAAANPTWTDEQLYQKARRWVIATIQRITLNYYYPMRLGSAPPPYAGYDPTVNTAIDLAFSNVGLRYGHTALNSMVYRLDAEGHPIPEGHLILEENFFAANVASVVSVGIEPILYGFATQPENEIDGRYAPTVRNRFPMYPYPARFDLAAVSIQRGREMGMADYNTLRAAYNLSRVNSWSEITNDTKVADQLTLLYSGMDNVDAYVGSIIESHDEGSSIGPLSTAIIKEQLLRARDGDRFWYENPGLFTAEELTEIESINLGSLIIANTNISVFPANPFAIAVPDYILGDTTLATASATTASVVVLDMIKFSWIISGSEIKFTVESNSDGWFAFGFGANMLPADIYLFRHDTTADGSWMCQDSYSKDLAVPQPDSSYGGSSSVTNFVSISSASYRHAFTFTRLLDTKDPFDVAITKSDMAMIFAYGSSSSPSYHGALDRAHATINFYSGSVSVSDTASTIFNLNIFHGATMYLGFAVIYPTGIYIARCWKDGGNWVAYHQFLMGAVTTEIVAAALMALIGGFGSGQPHTYLGVALPVLIVAVTILGRFSSHLDGAFSKKHSRKLRLAHRTLGYTAYSTGIAQGYLGVRDITLGTGAVWLKYFYFPSVLFVPLCLVLLAWRNNRQDGGKNTCVKSDTLPKFDWDDVHDRVENGSKLIVVNCIVYDVGLFLLKHPGGARVIANVVGLDATAHFYGKPTGKTAKVDAKSGKSTKSLVDPLGGTYHQHSRLAESHLSKLAIGILCDDATPRQEGKQKKGTVQVSHLTNVEKTAEAPDIEASGTGDELGADPDDPVSRAFKSLSKDHVDGTTLDLQRPSALSSPNAFRTYQLASRTIASSLQSLRPTHRLVFSLMDPEDEVFFLPGQCVILQHIDEDGEVVTRMYTPYRCRNRGTLDLFVKSMFGGAMSAHLRECKAIRIRGPFTHADALNPRRKNGCWDAVGMVAGGSGLTPMLLIIDYHLRYSDRDPTTGGPSTTLHLLNINHSDIDMFGEAELTTAQAASKGRLKVTHLCSTITNPTHYAGQTGHLDSSILSSTMPSVKPSSNVNNNNINNINNNGRTSQTTTNPTATLSKIHSLHQAATAGTGSLTPSRSLSMNRPGGTKKRSASVDRRLESYGTLPVLPPASRSSVSGRLLEDPDSVGGHDGETAETAVDTVIFLCGPGGLQAATLEMLLGLGFDPHQIVIL